ncbi:MAG: hypothetical protein JSR64_02675 [Nitrospira sp.]|nr:hypothetical protein [Nitrospira sp.]MBS0193230.1 hypothetical protein [Pseudomonadota bacterium]
MKPIQAIAVLAVMTLSQLALASSSTQTQVPRWLVGFWVQTVDEDGKPRTDTLEFKSDGAVVEHGPSCQRLPAGAIHIYHGNIYATFVIRKGPIAIVLVPSKDLKHLTWTSYATGNNAVFEPSKVASCVPAKS